MCEMILPMYKPESHVDLVNRLITTARDKFGFELLGWAHLMMEDRNLCLESYGPDIRWSRTPNTEFEIVCCLKINNMAYIFSSTGFEVKTEYEPYYKNVSEQMDKRNEEAEKEMWRNKLRSVGVEPEW